MTKPIDTMAQQKNALRSEGLKKRRALPMAYRKQADLQITETLMQDEEVKKASMLCVYMSLPDEVDTLSLVDSLLALGKQVAVPRVSVDTLGLHIISSRVDLVPGAFGILEPTSVCERITVLGIDIFIVPGIVFDMRRFRLGWGKGYYDKLLQSSTQPKIGLAYDVQVIAEVPDTSYDVPMTKVITEKQIIHP